MQEETRYDPPLTERGVEQSRRAGEWLRAALAGYRHHHACTTAAAAVVYASPTSRTISTAVEVARALRGEVGGRCVTSLTLHHGLNCCAAAKHHGVGQVMTPHAAAEGLAAAARLTLACWPPAGDVETINARHRRALGFLDTCFELAAMPPPPTPLQPPREEQDGGFGGSGGATSLDEAPPLVPLSVVQDVLWWSIGWCSAPHLSVPLSALCCGRM